MYTFREKIILDELYRNNKHTNVSDLAKICSVTSRTILNDVENIKYKLSGDTIKLFTKPGVGISLQVPEDRKISFENEMDIFSEILNPVLPDDRAIYIVKLLIETDKPVTFDEIADKLYVSKSTVAKDFVKVENYISKYGAELSKQQKHGTKLIAEEKTRRIIKANILKSLMSKYKYNANYELSSILDYPEADKIKDVLIDVEGEFNYLLSDVSFQGLLIHIAISLKRIKQGHRILMDRDELDLLKSRYEWKIASRISERINEIHKIDIGESEIGYITIHLAGAKLQNDIETEKVSLEHLNKLDNKLYALLKEILSKLTRETLCDFTNDKKLFTALFLHLRAAINRAKNNIYLDNPLLGEVKKEYTMAYELAVIAYRDIEKMYGISVSDNEIGYTAMHFAASIERLKKMKKTAVLICATGMGTSQLLFSKFNRLFPEVDVIDIISTVNAGKKIYELSPDIVLSTVPLKSDFKNIVNVSPILSANDAENIRKVLWRKSKVLNDEEISNGNILKKFINTDCVFLDVHEDKKEDVIKFMAEKLREKGYVKEGFLNSVLEREKFAGTYIGNCVAMPHSYEGFINKSAISAAVIKTPVKWGDSKVQLVFMLALDITAKKDFREIFDKLSDVINDKNIIEKLLNCNQEDEFLNILRQ